MPFQIVEYNIKFVPCDAVVEPSYEDLESLLSGGLDAAPAVKCSYEPSRRENCRYVIRVPLFLGTGALPDEEIIRRGYRDALKIADGLSLARVAFPLMGSWSKTCSREELLQIAAEEFRAWLQDHTETDLLLVVRDRDELRPDRALLAGVSEYIRVVEKQEELLLVREEALENVSTEALPMLTDEEIRTATSRKETVCSPSLAPTDSAPKAKRPVKLPGTGRIKAPAASGKLGAREGKRPGLVLPIGAFSPELGANLDESFSQMVMRKIKENGYEKDSEVYSRANIDRRLFSRIRSDRSYHPNKNTALALAVALELSLAETNELLLKAGYSLSHSILSDVIVEYCILQKIYNVHTVNILLFDFHQPPLGRNLSLLE